VFVRRLASWLKKSGKVASPEWLQYVKTGFFKELPPQNPDWFYTRMAAVARRVYMRCPTGVGALARRFGGKNKRRGVRPNHTGTGSRKIIRHSLQELEKLGFMKKKAHKGRKLTRNGRSFMDEFSGRVRRSAMVTEYYKRKLKAEKVKRKQGKRAINPEAGGATQTAGADTQAHYEEMEQPHTMDTQEPENEEFFK